jgi:hypothetical protein
MGDGDRVFRDIKIAFLYFFSTGHVKYRLWLFRMLAYDMSLLTPRKAFEYRWNVSANVNGGIDANIPDDNLVELNVKLLKEHLRAQGPNVSYESAKTACLSMKYIDAVKCNLLSSCGCNKRHGKRSEVDKMADIQTIATELKTSNNKCNNMHDQYRDPVLRVNVAALHPWITEQKLVIATLMQRNI